MTREEAIEVVKKNWPDSRYTLLREALETLIPELRDSEDEKIRKTLIEELSACNTVGELKFRLPAPTREECIAWLEKQKEASKAIEAIERIDKYIDEHVANAHDMKDSDPDKKYYLGLDAALGKMSGLLQDVYSGEKQKEQKPAEVDESTKRLNDNWMKQHFDDYEEQKPAQSREEILHQLFQSGSITLSDYLYLTGEQKPKQGWSEEDTEMYINVASSLRGYACGLENEEHKKHIKKGLDWLENRFKSLHPQPRVEWSEEDEKMRCNILNALTPNLVYSCGKGTSTGTSMYKYDEEIKWLKSLRPSWKPSEEQMEALDEYIYAKYPNTEKYSKAVLSLRDELKELM